MKRMHWILALVLTLAMMFSLAACASEPAGEDAAQAPAEDAVFTCGDMKLTVPAQYADLVIVETDPDDASFVVSEKASVEASGAPDGAGWLFTAARIDENTLHELRMADFQGAEVFARDAEGNYYCLYHPSDLRIFRDGTITEEDMDQWSTLSEWAGGVPEAFRAENDGLEAFTVSDTDLDGLLARAAYQDDASFTISATAYGEQQPGGVKKSAYFDQLLDGTVFEIWENGDAPDGEYIVLNLPDENVQLRFYLSEPNTIGVVREDQVDYYVARFADKSVKAVDIMQSWYDALVEANA